MSDYYIFSQAQGPTIDTDLLSRAVVSGVNAGNAQKTTVQAIAEGITGGITTGVETYSRIQDIQIKQQQIDQAPLELQIKEQQLKNEQLKREIQQLELKTKLLNEEQEAKLAKEETTRKLSVLEGNKVINDALASNDPVKWREAFKSTDAQAAMQADPELAKRAASLTKRKRPDGTFEFSHEEQAATASMADYVGELNRANKLSEANAAANAALAKEVQTNFEKVKENPNLRALLNGQDLSEFVSSTEAYPVGQKSFNADGSLNTKAPDQPLTGKVEEYEVVRNGKRTGQIIEKAEAQSVYALKDSYNRVFGNRQTTSAGTTDTQQKKTELPPNAAQQDVSNDRIVQQRVEQFNALAKKPPEGIVPGALEDRLKMKKEEIRRKFSTTTYIAPSNTIPAREPTPVFSPTPPSANSAISTAVGAPVTLNTKVNFTPRNEVWTRVNSEPLLSNEMALIKGLSTVEAPDGSPSVSPTGVKGLLMVTRATAAQYGLDRDIPEQQILAGKKYLYENLVRFDGNLRLALTAYNAGPGHVLEAIKEVGSTDWDLVHAELQKRLSADKWKEVETYADRVISAASHYIQPGEKDQAFLQLLAENGLITNA